MNYEDDSSLTLIEIVMFLMVALLVAPILFVLNSYKRSLGK